MRCVREEHTAINMNLHYLENGTVMLNFIYQKELFFLPLGFALKVPGLLGTTELVLAAALHVVLRSTGAGRLHRFADLPGADQRQRGQLLLQELRV